MAAFAAVAAGVTLALHGCGGSDEPSGSTSTSVETTTTTTSTTTSHSAPLSAEEVVDLMNKEYISYDPEDDSSGIGVVIRTTSTWEFFCPGFETYKGCYKGAEICGTSASILNDRMMLESDGTVSFGLSRASGIVFNATLIEEKLAKCTYQFDGASMGRYNHGCGDVARSFGKTADCNPGAESAFWNIDPKTGQNVTDTSECVQHDYCPNRDQPPTAPAEGGCYWKGVAFYSGSATPSETRKMLEQRITNQGTNPGYKAQWNEVVIDTAMLLEELKKDPAKAVLAMIYTISQDELKTSIAKDTATAMSKAMAAEFGVPGGGVPVIGLDSSVVVTNASGTNASNPRPFVAAQTAIV